MTAGPILSLLFWLVLQCSGTTSADVERHLQQGAGAQLSANKTHASFPAGQDDRWQELSVGRQLLQEGQQAAAARAKMVADTAASFQVRFAAEAEDSAGGGELLWDDMNIVVLPVSKLAANVKAAVQSDSQQAAQQQQQGRQSAFAHTAADLNEDDEYLKLQQQPQVTLAEARNQYRRPARLAGRLAQLQAPPRPVEEQAQEEGGRLYRPVVTPDGVNTDRVDEWPLVEPPFKEAYHECVGETVKHRVCKYYNLLLWNGTLYYPTTDEMVLQHGPPKVPLSWVPLHPFTKQVLTQNTWLDVVHPSQLPFSWPRRPKLAMPHALLWELTFQDNYGHMLGEHGPIMHTVLCAYLGRCTYSDEDLKGLHIVVTNSRTDMVQIVPAAAHEMFGCFSKKAVMQVNDAFFEGHVVVIDTLLAGIGPTCRGYPYCREEFGRNPIVPTMVRTWQERLLQCVKLPTHVVAPADRPNIAIVNRPYDAGRGFLNLDEVAAHIELHFPKANVTTHVLEGKSLAEQARIYFNATIIIQTHGAALGNMVFMPRGSVVIDVVPANNADKAPWVMFMGADYRPLHILPITLPQQKTVLMMHKVRRSKEWAMMTPYWRQRLLREGVCPEYTEVYWQFDPYAACNFQWFLKHANIILNPEEVVSGLQQAIEHIQFFRSQHDNTGLYFQVYHDPQA